MKSVTDNAIVEKIKGTGRTFTMSLKVGENTYSNIKSLKKSTIFASNQKFTVGEAVSSFIEAEINDCFESLENYEVQPILHIDGYDIPLGFFTVQSPSQSDGKGTQKITAFDRMYKTNSYTFDVTNITSAIELFNYVVSVCNTGSWISTDGLTDIVIDSSVLVGRSGREVLAYLAGLFGKNCIVDTDEKGTFRMVGYSTVSESDCIISIDSLDTLDFPAQASTIDYFNVAVNDTTTYKSGAGNNGVNIVNPLFTSSEQTKVILADLKSSVGGNGYYPAKFRQLNGDPRIEAGDVIKVEHRDILTGDVKSDYVPVMSLTMEYDGGVSVSIESYPTESEFSMSVSDKLNFSNDSFNNQLNIYDKTISNIAGFVGALEEKTSGFNQAISNSLGLYLSTKQGTGGDTKYYYHNKPTLEESTYIFGMTDKGFAVAYDWNNGNPSWQYGISADGNAIFNYLIANKITADILEAGTITSLPSAKVRSTWSLDNGFMSFEMDSAIITDTDSGTEPTTKTYDISVTIQGSEENKDGVILGAGTILRNKTNDTFWAMSFNGVHYTTAEYYKALNAFLNGVTSEKPIDPYYSFLGERHLKTKDVFCQNINVYQDGVAYSLLEKIGALERKSNALQTEIEKLNNQVGNYSLTVIAEPSHGGVVVPSGYAIPYPKNTVVDLKATPKSDDGYKFIGWFKDDVRRSKSESYSITLNDNMEYVAKFAKFSDIELTAGLSQEIPVISREYVYFKLVVSLTHSYTIESAYTVENLSSDVHAVICSSDLSECYSKDEDGGMFSLKTNLTAGQTYYLGIRLWAGDTKNIKINISYY